MELPAVEGRPRLAARALQAVGRAATDRDRIHFEIVDLPEIKQVLIFDIGGPNTWRTVYTDGRKHPANLEPSFYGHSIGWWEGDTLLVDSVGFNEKNWIDAMGLVHTDQYRQLERFTRLDSNWLKSRGDRRRSGRVYSEMDGGVPLALERGRRAVQVPLSSRTT